MQTFLNILMIISFPAKVWLHIYIAQINGRELTLNGINDSTELFWFYIKPVTKDSAKLKMACNFLYLLFILSVVLFIICSKNST